VRDGSRGDCVAPTKLPLCRNQPLETIRVALTDEAYDAIASTLPKGAARWPMQRDRGQCFIQVEAAVVDRMRVMRVPGESYSEVILRLVELKTAT
jgi:hypothetical protein